MDAIQLINEPPNTPTHTHTHTHTQLQLDASFSSQLIACVTRSKIDGAKIADCKDNSDNFAKLFGKQFPDQQMVDCFLALTSYLSAAVSQVCSKASVNCLTVCGLPVGCPEISLSIPF